MNSMTKTILAALAIAAALLFYLSYFVVDQKHKALVLRFGGSDAYRKTIPLFLGLALGDFIMMTFWVLVDGWTGRAGHYLLPL